MSDLEVCGGEGPHFFYLRLTDLDADGDPDVVNSRYGMSFAWVNNGSGRFERSRLPIPPDASFCDLNGDGYKDVVSRESELVIQCDSMGNCGEGGLLPRGGETGIRVYLNDRTGRFESHAFLPLSQLARASNTLTWFIDIDNDGDMDVIYTDGPGRLYPVGVLRNDGTGHLTRSGVGIATVENGRIGAGDLNNDGYVDLVITHLNQPAQVWMNGGSGTIEMSDAIHATSVISARKKTTGRRTRPRTKSWVVRDRCSGGGSSSRSRNQSKAAAPKRLGHTRFRAVKGSLRNCSRLRRRQVYHILTLATCRYLGAVVPPAASPGVATD